MADEVTEKYLEWIKQGLAQPGKTQSGLAKHLGIAHPQITQLLQGKRSLKVSEPPKIAEYLELPDPFSEIRPATSRLVPIPVIGKTEAGSFREVDDMDQSEPVFLSLPPDERFPGARQVAFDVEGDSMNALRPRPILPGDRAVCVAYEDVAHDATLRDGMVVVVERTRDGGHTREWSIKQVEIYADRTEFHPRSNNPKHKPIVVKRDMHADEGTVVEIIGLVRRVVNDFEF
ncbi:XRE family transcriptional regulator [Phyllobacterium sp. 21LDTY02-6]|nr:XRE family transcriptional regulator [Phyllobacterium sp. 21LDTY02-6]MCO4316314.1 XRE family transcriptional regulator [Phyllobacterium sp. 21LDTY02-6]